MRIKKKRDREGFRAHILKLSDEKLICLEASLVDHVDRLNDDVDYAIELLSDIDDLMMLREGITFENITRQK